jgi:predicted DNA-binding protein (MmcQ/YjbR family)
LFLGPIMNAEELKSVCRGYAGATEALHGAPSNVLVYAVGEKTFAYFKTSEPEKWRFSTRVSADRFVELTDIPGVKPARYMGRFHWVTIVNVDHFPPAYLAELVEWSYRKALGSLSKAKQRAIAGAETTD